MPSLRYFLAACCMIVTATAQGDDIALVNKTLDNFHQAASRADSVAYFEAMADNVVFLGTDGSERWQGQEFRDFVTRHFSAGQGWTYTPLQRDIIISPSGDTAWFDESLDNEGLGNCRGSGVLVRSAAGWKIAQYNLSVPIPNDMVYQVAADIAAPASVAGDVTAPGTGAMTAVAAPPETPGTSPDAAAPDASPQGTTTDYGCSGRRFKTNRKAGC